MTEPEKSFTGRRRERTTRKGVLIADVLSRFFITAGGIGTIVAVLGVCVFLVWVVLPLFQSARVSDPQAVTGAVSGTMAPIHVSIDEYQALGCLLMSNGRIEIFRIDTGTTIEERVLFQDLEITCASFLIQRDEGVLGFSDGSIQLVYLGFETAYLEQEEVPGEVREELSSKPAGAVVTMGTGIVQLTPEGQYRHQQLLFNPISSTQVSDKPIRLIDFVVRPSGPLICCLAGDEKEPEFRAISGKERENFLSGEKEFVFDPPIDLPYEAVTSASPCHLKISGTGTNVYLAWEDGWMLRLRCDSLEDAFPAERGRLVKPGVSLTTMDFNLGESTLIWGDSEGHVRGGFPVRIEELEGQGLYEVWRNREKAHFTFAITKNLGRFDSILRSLAPSGRSRLILMGFENGEVRLASVTSEAILASLDGGSGKPVTSLAVSPKGDGFITVTPYRVYHCHLNPKYPEASLISLFRPVWYEGYSRPLHMWQSSSATDDSESKLGLIPLIFGTLKATFYAMLFGAPLALLAAIYSSEFLNPRVKAYVKPTIELMASLPSVVLGFLAALVFAPFVEKVVPTTLMIFVTLPFCFLLAAYLWQLLPGGFTRRLESWRPLFIVIPMLLGVLLGAVLGPWMDGLLFGGDLKGWLAEGGRAGGTDSESGSAAGGWMILILPFCVLLAVLLSERLAMPWIRRSVMSMERSAVAWIALAKFALVTLFAVGLTVLISALLSQIGVDPRDDWHILAMDVSPLDIYVQRNALIVGFVMGFAIIPIIYTIADDALSAVPEHLRSASLGSGATPWQTTTRIVIPTAMSGLFSALMIGLGRAVGETMIVLMALGNTAIMDWNIFNGARTLSANIAVELPEAVRNSGHYRILFLSALVLFAMTFVVNTVAEMVRLRFRKRAYQL